MSEHLGDDPSGPPTAYLVAQDEALAAGESWPGDDDADVLKRLHALWPAALKAERLGRFVLDRELGRGGFGVVYLAFDPTLGRQVALKVPRPEVLATPEVRRRFVVEARAAGSLDHPNLVPVFESGEVGPIAYIASAYVPGQTLAAWLAGQPEPIPCADAARLTATLAEAIQHAHDRGVLHRDLKPSNILMQPAEGSPTGFFPRVTDFGLAKLVGGEADLTVSGIPFGSAPYMSPEQADGRLSAIGPATDIHALGVILYEMLAGSPPYRGATPLQTLDEVRRSVAEPPSRRRRGVPRDLEVLVAKCLEKDPARRFGSTAELADELRRHLAGSAIRTRPTPALERIWKWARHRPTAAALAATLVATTAAAVAGLAWHDYQLRQVNDQQSQTNDQLSRANGQLITALRRADEQGAIVRRTNRADRIHEAGLDVALGRVDLARERLDGARPEPGETDFAWTYLDRLVRHAVMVLAHEDGDSVQAVAVSRGGGLLATSGPRGTIRLWDAANGRRGATLRGPGAGTWHEIAFSPRGDRVAATRDRPGGLILAVWDVPTGLLLANRDIVGNQAHRLEFSPAGEVLTLASFAIRKQIDDLVRLETRGWTPMRAIVSDRWRTETTAMDLTADGATLALAGPEGRVTLIDAVSGEIRGAYPLDSAPARWIVLSPDGMIAALLDRDGVIRIVEAATGRVRAISEPFPEAWALAIAPGARQVAVILNDRTVRVFDALTGRTGPLLGRITNFDIPLAFSPDGSLVALGGEDGVIRVFDSTTGAARMALTGTRKAARWLAFTPDGWSILVADGDTKAQLWRLATDIVTASPGHKPEAWSLAFSPGGRILASGGDDHLVRLRDPGSGAVVATLDGHTSTVSSLAFSLDGRLLASASLDGKVRVWNVTSRKCTAILAGPGTSKVRAVAFRPDGREIASAGDDHYIRLWDVKAGKILVTLSGHTDRVRSLAYSPDGQTLASASEDRSVRFWDVEARDLRSISIGLGERTSLAYSGDGSTLAVGDLNGILTLICTAPGSDPISFKDQTAEIRAVAFTPDGRSIATAGLDRVIRIRDVPSGHELLALPALTEQVNALAFSPDGLTLISADHAGFVHIWR